MLANPTLHKAGRQRRDYASLILVSAVLLLTLVAGLACGWLMVQTVAGYYDSRMYPNVYVLEMKLGRLTPKEATAVLSDAAQRADVGTGLLTLHDGENRWSVNWSEAGMHLDVQATVRAAFAVGHAGDRRWQDRVWEWLQRSDVTPIFTVDEKQARQSLERLAPSVAVPPTDAALRLPQRADDPVIAVPGRPGRELDIEATLTKMLTGINGSAQSSQVDLLFLMVPPHVQDVSSQQTHVEEMLNRRIYLSTYDVLTDEAFSWTLGRRDIVTWLQVAHTADGPAVTIDQDAVQRTLMGLADELGPGRAFRWTEATEQVVNVLNTGGGAVTLYLTHAERFSIVQPGDTFSSIAAAFGMTSWHVLQVNPDVSPNWLTVGQELTIPSQDELTPLMPVAHKKVVVSTTEQRMRVYENGKTLHDWPVSTGIAESPTHKGVFQVLGKDKNAYASLWDLWMPHFVAIYAAGPDFYNGFHGLPTLSSGRRLWEGSLGSPASYGCIILGLEEAEAFFQWAELGVTVVVE